MNEFAVYTSQVDTTAASNSRPGLIPANGAGQLERTTMTKSNERTTSYRKWMREAYTHNAGWTLPELATFISGADDRTSEAWVDAAMRYL